MTPQKMTMQTAYAMLPPDAKWSCSFGYPGQGGFTEYYRTPAGEKWVISNGSWDAVDVKTNWNCEQKA